MYSFPPEFSAMLWLTSMLIEFFAVVFLIFAIFHALYRILRTEVLHDKRFHEYEHAKRTMIQKIIFALDFFVAADLIKLTMLFDFEDILKVTLVVAMRTMLSWSLGKEIHLHKE